jgi:uncharacterized protein
MPHDMMYCLTVIPAAVLLGLSKGGFAGLGVLALPLMALAISPVTAAAIILPVLLVSDWVSVWAFRRDFSIRNLVILIPASIVGVTLGWLLAARVSEDVVRLAVGLISVLFVVYMVMRDRLGAGVQKPGIPSGLLWGAVAGFTSFVSHSGVPPFQIYVMPQKLNPRIYAGTQTIVFAAINLLKVPPYFFLGQLSRQNLIASAWLMPIAVVSALGGIWLVRRVSTDRFYAIILAVTFLIGAKLTWDAALVLV